MILRDEAYREAVKQGIEACDSFYLENGDDCDRLVKEGSLSYPSNPFEGIDESQEAGWWYGWNSHYPERWKEAL